MIYFIEVGASFVGDSVLAPTVQFSQQHLERRQAVSTQTTLAFERAAVDNSSGGGGVPPKFRKSTFEWLLAWCNGFSAVTPEGISHIMVSKEQLDDFSVSDPWEWNSSNVCIDQGSDGICATQTLDSVDGPILANLKADHDKSHGYHRDFVLIDGKMQQKSQRAAYRLARNCHLGPYGTAARYQELRQCWQDYKAVMSAESCNVLASLLPEFLDDSDEMHRLCEPDILQVIWQRHDQFRLYHFHGSEEDAARFLSDHIQSKKVTPLQTHYFYAYFILMFMQNKLNGTKLSDKFKDLHIVKKAKITPLADSSIKIGSKADKRDAPVDHNQAHLAFLTFGNFEYKMFERSKIEVRDPYFRHHSHLNSKLRDVREVPSWEVDQILGGAWNPCYESLGILYSLDVLHHCGIFIGKADEFHAKLVLDHPFVRWQAELSEFIGKYAVRLYGLRLKRELPLLRGWPKLEVLCIKPELQFKCLDQFRADLEGFKMISAFKKGFGVMLAQLAQQSQQQYHHGSHMQGKRSVICRVCVCVLLYALLSYCMHCCVVVLCLFSLLVAFSCCDVHGIAPLSF